MKVRAKYQFKTSKGGKLYERGTEYDIKFEEYDKFRTHFDVLDLEELKKESTPKEPDGEDKNNP